MKCEGENLVLYKSRVDMIFVLGLSGHCCSGEFITFSKRLYT